MRLECSRHGSVVSVIIPKNTVFSSINDAVKVFVEMSTIEQSSQVLNFFKGKIIHCYTNDYQSIT
jgi:hypothetical protein